MCLRSLSLSVMMVMMLVFLRRSPIQVSRADPASLSSPNEIELAWAIQLRADKLNYADWIWETQVSVPTLPWKPPSHTLSAKPIFPALV